jgi:iron complex outermembrane recepter protein
MHMNFTLSKHRASFRRRLLLTGSAAAVLAIAYSNVASAQTAAPNATAPVSIQTAAAAAAGPANAPQSAAAAPESAPEAITVTGSRIKAPGLVSANPIETMTSVDIEETGLQNMSEILAQMPQFQNNQTPSNSGNFINGADINAANLRGIGPYRTLTLIDGVRQVGSLSGVNNSGGTGIVDLNTIPPLLIDSVDVVTGGQSAVYGADAVAGVVNFKLKKNFEGAEAEAEYGTTTDGGGTTTSFDGIFGANFAQDRGNITVTTDYANTAEINNSQRPNLGNDSGQLGQPIFTQTNPSHLVCCVANGFLNQSGAPVIASQIGNNAPFTQTFNTAGTALLPFNPGTPIPGFAGALTFAGTGEGLSNVDETLVPPNHRIVDEAILTYNLANGLGPFKDINFHFDFKYADSNGLYFSDFPGQASPPGQGIAQGTLTIQSNNPFLPTALKNELAAAGMTSFQIARSLQGFDTEQLSYDYSIYRTVLGFNGEFLNGWNYDVYYNYGQNTSTFLNGDAFENNLQNAVNAVVAPNGTIVCAVQLTNSNSGCTPINPFKVGGLTQAQQRSIFFDSKEVDVLEESDAAYNMNGDLIHYNTPFTGTNVPLSFATGLEWREESTNSNLDTPSQQPVGADNQNLTEGNQLANSPTAGIYTTKEVYMELRAPVLRDLPFAQAVDIDGAIRGQDYSDTGDNYTWDFSATWKFNDDVMMRGSIGKSVRAPNGDELFSAGGQSFVTVADPCTASALVGQPKTAANCHAQGVPVGFVTNPAEPSSTFLGGNPGLSAETGRDWTAGFVFTPTFIPRFSTSADVYQIHIQNPIESGDTTTIVDDCAVNNVGCGNVQRRADGSIAEVLTPYVNGAMEKITGLDWTANYRITDDQLPFLPPGSNWSFSGNLTYIPQHYILTNTSGGADNGGQEYLAGQFGFPRFSGSFHTQYTDGPYSFGYNLRFIGETTEFDQGTGILFTPMTIPTIWYNDINASYTWRNLTFSAGVQNLADQLPPEAALAISEQVGVTRPGEEPLQSYDLTGRFIYTKLKVSF